jgi:hypothetical protein
MFDHYVVVELFPSRLSRVLLFFENYLLAWRPAGKFSHIPVTVLVTVTSALIFFEESCRLTLPSAWEQSIQKTAMPEIDSFTSVWGTFGSAQIQGLRFTVCRDVMLPTGRMCGRMLISILSGARVLLWDVPETLCTMGGM